MPGRNETCPCGSGKKYKKCCLAKDQASKFAAMTMAPQALGKLQASADEPVVQTSRTPPREIAPRPPEPWEPRWREFEEADLDGKIRLFRQTLDEPELVDDNMMFEMLSAFREKAHAVGRRAESSALIQELRQRYPEVYRQSAAYYLETEIEDAIDVGGDVHRPGLELAQHVDRLDSFDRAAELLQYHGHVRTLVGMYRIVWASMKPGAPSSDEELATQEELAATAESELTEQELSEEEDDEEEFEESEDEESEDEESEDEEWEDEEWEDEEEDEESDWFDPAFAWYAIQVELVHYLQSTAAPDAADPELRGRLREFLDGFDEQWVGEYVAHWLSQATRDWKLEDFRMQPWSGDDDSFDDLGRKNLRLLAAEFVHYLHTVEKMPLARAEMGCAELVSYLINRVDRQGNRSGHGKKSKRTTGPHVLCPDRPTLETYLGNMLHFFTMRLYATAALLEVVPHWLRFLEGRKLLDAQQRGTARSNLAALIADVAPFYRDKPNHALGENVRVAWGLDSLPAGKDVRR